MIRSWTSRLTDPWVGKAGGDRAQSKHDEKPKRQLCACDGRVAPPGCDVCRPKGFDLTDVKLAPCRELGTPWERRLLAPYLEHGRITERSLDHIRATPTAHREHLIELATCRLHDHVLVVPDRAASAMSQLVAPLGHAGDRLAKILAADPDSAERARHQLIAGCTSVGMGPELGAVLEVVLAHGHEDLARVLGEDLAHLVPASIDPEVSQIGSERRVADSHLDAVAFMLGKLLGPVLVRAASQQGRSQLSRFVDSATRLPAFVHAREVLARRRRIPHVVVSAAELVALDRSYSRGSVERMRASLGAAAVSSWTRAARGIADTLCHDGVVELTLTGAPREIDRVIDALREAGFAPDVRRSDQATTVHARRA